MPDPPITDDLLRRVNSRINLEGLLPDGDTRLAADLRALVAAVERLPYLKAMADAADDWFRGSIDDGELESRVRAIRANAERAAATARGKA